MQCEIEGVIIKELTRHIDNRGWLIELFRHDELAEEFHPVMSYLSMTKPGVTRGPHEHKSQADLFCFIGPGMFRLYLWDNRPDSATRGRKCVMDVGQKRHTLVIVPSGVVHAYKNVSSIDGFVFNAPNRLYAGESRKGPVDEIRYEDDAKSHFRFDD